MASPGYGSWLARHERVAPAADLAGGPRISVIAAAPEQAAESLRGQSYTRWQLSPGAEYTAFIGAGDTLAPHALAWVAAAIAASRAEAVYTDEDVIENGRARPVFKPDWSPALLAQQAYPGGLLVVATAALRDCAPASGHDAPAARAVLERLAASRGKAAHVPRVLYHRGGPLPEIKKSGGAAQECEPAPLASIIICSRQPWLLESCLDAIEAGTSYQRRETVAVQHSFDAALGDKRVRWTGAFDFAAMNNLAARSASGEVLVFLNDDVRPLAPEWLGALVAQVVRRDVGIAGALLEYPDGAIQHAGVVVGIAGVAAHPLRGQVESALWRWACCTREVSAVTAACLAIRKSVFDELGGFDTAFPVNYNDVDLCLRARRAGYEVILESRARLLHGESRTRNGKTHAIERGLFIERWREVIQGGDPYYSPNLSYRRELPLLAWE